ncbi:uncharacterized protein [Anabrus simplex]
MERAVSAVIEEGCTIRDAAQQYNVPFETLRRRVKKIRPSPIPRTHLGTVFNNEQEQALAVRLQILMKRGFTLTRSDIRRSAYKYAELMGVPHRFDSEHKMAGADWLHGFLTRNPSLVVKRPDQQPLVDRLTREWLDKFYDIVENVIEEYNLKDQPGYIYNVGESKFLLSNELDIISTADGDCNISKDETVTVLSCCNASGVFVPPVVIFKGLWHQRDITDGLPPGADVFMTSNGCMNEETLLWWLDHFAKYKPSDGTVLLLLDGHNSYSKSLPVIEFCLQNNIICVCLPRHTTRALHPMDKAFFKALRTAYKQAARQWCYDNPEQTMTKEHFGPVLAEAWDKAATVENSVPGFASLGIFPFNRRAILNNGFSVQTVKSEIVPMPVAVPSPDPPRKEDEEEEEIEMEQFQEVPMTSSVVSGIKVETGENISRNGDISIYPVIQVKKKCNFCGQMSGMPTTSLKADWIRCDVCNEWYHQYCVGVHGKATLVCGKCV